VGDDGTPFVTARWRRFRAAGDDLVLSLTPEEAEFLAGLPAEMREVLEGPLDDPAGQRLFPSAYLDPTEEQGEAEWQAMIVPDLLRARLDALDLVGATLARAQQEGSWMLITLTPDEVQAWLGVLNDTRLVLGSRLGVTEDDDCIQADPTQAGAFQVYEWLTQLQSDLVDQLLH
jgi:hypothetical protein